MEITKRNYEMELHRMRDLPFQNVKEVVFHHSAGSVNSTAAGINHYHMNGRGWAGIAYHYIIRGSGEIQEGRPLDKEGVHAARPANGESWAICLLGNFENHPPTKEQYQSAQWLYWELKGMKGDITPSVHKDHMATLCPGKHFDLDKATAPLPVTNGTFYRVVTGSFKNRDNALNRVQELKNAGFDSFITTFKKD